MVTTGVDMILLLSSYWGGEGGDSQEILMPAANMEQHRHEGQGRPGCLLGVLVK